MIFDCPASDAEIRIMVIRRGYRISDRRGRGGGVLLIVNSFHSDHLLTIVDVKL